MSDDPTKRGGADRKRINLEESYEVRYWSENFEVTEAVLKATVETVGPMVDDVADALGRVPR